MAVTSVIAINEGRGGSINSNSETSYTRVFDVTTDDPDTGPKAVRINAGIPQLGDYYTNGLGPYDDEYEEDLGAFVNEVQVDSIDGHPNAWKVTVKYGPGNTLEQSGDPTLWKVRVQFGGERTERVVDFDIDGNPLMNSAGDRFGDPVTVDSHISTMVIKRNEKVATFDLELASEYSDTINDATWNGFPARTCKMGIISTSEEQYDPSTNTYYYTVEYPIKINRNTWIKELLDQGYNELDAYGNSQPIMYKGQQVSDPRPLDGTGLALDGTAGYSSPVVLPFRVEEEKDWSGLSINLATRLGV